MAGLYTYQNPFLGNKNKLVKAFSKRNSIFSSFSVVFYASTPAPTQAFAPTSASASVLSLLERYIDKNLQKTTKLTLKSFVKGQKHSQLQITFIPYK